MNLLFTLTAYPPTIGGAQLHLHQLARHLNGRHSVSVVTQWDTQRSDWLWGTTMRAPSTPRSYEIDGVSVHRLAVPRSDRWGLAPWVMGYFAIQGPALARISAVLARQLLPQAGAADLIHNGRIGREGLSYASYQVARKRDIPFVLTPVHHPRWSSWLHRQYQALYRRADAVIALTEIERQTLAQFGVDERRLFVTGHGPVLADQADAARCRQEWGIGDAPLVLFLGQKYAYKGVRQLLDASEAVWQREPTTRFVFLGPRTPYSRKLFSRARDRRVIEMDSVDLQTKTNALAACDMLCVPSTQESFGGVYTEAWSLGKPVIAADIPATREVVTDGEDGYLTACLAGPIAERIVQLLRNPAEARRLGANGQAKVATRYGWPRLAELTEAIYRRVLDGRG